MGPLLRPRDARKTPASPVDQDRQNDADSRRRLQASRDELLACLDHLLEAAGNPSLMTELKATLADHAVGNYRILMNLCDELLATAADRDLPKLDEKLYLDVYATPPKKAAKRK